MHVFQNQSVEQVQFQFYSARFEKLQDFFSVFILTFLSDINKIRALFVHSSYNVSKFSFVKIIM